MRAVVALCLLASALIVMGVDVVLGSKVAFRAVVESRRMGITDGWDTFTVVARPRDAGVSRVETIEVPVRYDEYWSAQAGSEVTVGFTRGLLSGHCYGIYVVAGRRV